MEQTEPEPTPIKRTLSLRSRLLGLLGLQLAVLLAGVLAAVVYFVFRTEEIAWQSRQREATQNAAATIGAFMQRVNATLNTVGLLDTDYLEARPEVLDGLLQDNPALLEIIRVDAAGNILSGAHRGQPVLASLFTLPQSEWFRQTRLGQAYTGGVQLSAHNQPYLILAVPTRDGGAVAAQLSMNVLWEVVAGIRFGKTGQAYVINSRGQVVAHSNPEFVLANASLAGRPEMTTLLATPDFQWHGAYQNLEGVTVVGTTGPIPATGWIVLTEVARAEAYAVTQQALWLLGGCLALFALLLSHVTDKMLLRQLFQPVEWLRAGAERIGQGDLDHRIPISRRDEVGQVAQAFNEMAVRLKDRETALALARDQALDASRLKSRLLANVSHDLRTPLNAILGYTEMLNEGIYTPINEEQQEITGRIIANSHRLLSLINSLLDQAQIEAGTLVLHNAVFPPAELLEDVYKMMLGQAQTKRLALIPEIGAEFPAFLNSDVQRLQQILVNLIGNAIKFTDQGSVRVRLLHLDEGHWAIEVSDTGRGIPPEAHEYIFEAFRQVDTPGSAARGGSGLGLSIVKQLTTLMGGEVQMTSEVGKGSTFRVVLPYLEMEKNPEAELWIE